MRQAVDTDTRGFCVWLTGLSGAGKSTLAAQLAAELSRGPRRVVVLDGDVVRRGISSDLGFTREDRNTNVRRVAALAAEVVRDAGIAICALMSPYDESRKEARALVGSDRFALVHVCTPLHVCETRDPKGLYRKARQQQIRYFIGVEEEYEAPRDADVFIDTSLDVVALGVLLRVLARKGFV